MPSLIISMAGCLAPCRSAGGVPAAVELLSRSPSTAQQLQLLSLVTALARSGEEAGAELAQAGAPTVLLQMVAIEPLPRTQVGTCSPVFWPPAEGPRTAPKVHCICCLRRFLQYSFTSHCSCSILK